MSSKEKSKIVFNKKFHFLGTLCHNGHEYEDTGKSVRYISKPSQCVTCVKMHRRSVKSAEEKAAKKKTKAICPKCRKEHTDFSKLVYIGTGTLWLYCKNCKDQIASYDQDAAAVCF